VGFAISKDMFTNGILVWVLQNPTLTRLMKNGSMYTAEDDFI
jgi:hypothetical protein